jgi:Flp pilus assembly protein TadG
MYNLQRITEDRGQSLVETALLLPLLLILTFNAVNCGYFFFVMLNLTAAPRQGVEYSIQGGQTTENSELPQPGPPSNPYDAATVSGMVYEAINGAITSTTVTPVQVCTTTAGLVDKGGANQAAMCVQNGSYAGALSSTTDIDPEAPYLVLHRVDVQYTVTPLIPGRASIILLPNNLTFHRYVQMRALQ